MIKQFKNLATMLLTDSPLDVPLTVTSIDAGREATARLTSMGILPGEKLMLKRKGSNGPVVLEVKGTRVAIGRGLGMKVLVTENDEE
jgi:ferrous iron transport protein A